MKISNILYTLLFIAMLTFLLCFTVDTFQSISTSLKLYVEKVFPSLFLFVLFTNILLNSNLVYVVSDCLSFISKPFGMPAKASIPIILGFLCGFPSASQAIDKLYADKMLTKRQCNYLMAFCNNASPTFIISTIGYSMLGSKKIGILLLIIHVSSSIIIATFYKIFMHKYIIQENFINLKGNLKNSSKSKENISTLNIIPKSILATFKTMVYILGYMILFNILSDILNGLSISNIKYITSTFELTKGISSFTNMNNLPYIAFLIGFSSFSIIFQIKSTLKTFDYPMQKIVLAKLIHGITSMFLAFIIF